MQLIKESALLFQYQRCSWELNEKPILVASWADLAHAIILGGPIMEATLTGFDKRLIEALPIIYEIIEDRGFVTTKSLHEKLKKSSKYAWQILNFLKITATSTMTVTQKEVVVSRGRPKSTLKPEQENIKVYF